MVSRRPNSMLTALCALALATGCRRPPPGADDFVSTHCREACAFSEDTNCCSSPLPDRRLVDAHTHFWTEQGFAALLSQLDGGERSMGPDLAIQLSLPFVSNWGLQGAVPTNNLVSFAAALTAPERIRVFASLDMTVACDGAASPALSGAALADALGAQVDTLADLGAVGLKFHFVPDAALEGVLETDACSFDREENRHRASNPAFAQVWARAEARGLPVLVHILEEGSFQQSHADLLAIANAHPDLVVILTHHGFTYDELVSHS